MKSKLKKTKTTVLSILLALSLILNPVTLLSQSSQYVLPQEEIADILDVVDDHIDQLESLDPDGDQIYTASAGLFLWLMLMFSSSQAAAEERYRKKLARLERQNERLQQDNRLRQQLTDQNDLETKALAERQAELEQSQNTLRANQRNLYRSNPHASSEQMWEYQRPQFSTENRQALAQIRITDAGDILYSHKMNQFNHLFEEFARRNRLVVHPELHLNVRPRWTSDYKINVALNFEKSFITIRDPRQPSVVLDRKSLRQIIDGEYFSLQIPGRVTGFGKSLADQLQSQIRRKFNYDFTVTRLNVKPFFRKWGSRFAILGALYWWFFSGDNESEDISDELSDVSYRLEMAPEQTQDLLSYLYEQREAFVNIQNSSNNENEFFNF